MPLTSAQKYRICYFISKIDMFMYFQNNSFGITQFCKCTEEYAPMHLNVVPSNNNIILHFTENFIDKILTKHSQTLKTALF